MAAARSRSARSAGTSQLGGSEFELETPNFSGIDGFNNAWELIPGVPTIAEVSTIAGIAVRRHHHADGRQNVALGRMVARWRVT